ncbi:MAG: hypothetical protein JWP04_42, partial [Belnapia sp.]|nr:hypothetical protein [Belnapia sp.]
MPDLAATDTTVLVDSAFYFRNHPEAAATGLSAAQHYDTVGWQLGYNPSPYFETSAYLAANADVLAAGQNPLTHYLDHGWHEGRSASPLFDGAWYLAHNPDVAAAGIDPLTHFVEFGAAEGRDPNPFFSIAEYRAAYPDVVASGMNPLAHYAEFGWHEGRNPSDAFDTAWYLRANPDVTASGGNPLEHFLRYGQAEHREPLPPSLTATAVDGVVIFGGTATGPITLQMDGEAASFSRMEVVVHLADFAGITGLVLAGDELAGPGEALSGKLVTGTGAVTVEGLTAATDLSGLDAGLQVTAHVPADTDIVGSAGLATVDRFEVATGATLTVGVAQAMAAVISGDYALLGPIGSLVDG